MHSDKVGLNVYADALSLLMAFKRSFQKVQRYFLIMVQPWVECKHAVRGFLPKFHLRAAAICQKCIMNAKKNPLNNV